MTLYENEPQMPSESLSSEPLTVPAAGEPAAQGTARTQRGSQKQAGVNSFLWEAVCCILSGPQVLFRASSHSIDSEASSTQPHSKPHPRRVFRKFTVCYDAILHACQSCLTQRTFQCPMISSHHFLELWGLFLQITILQPFYFIWLMIRKGMA